MNHPVRTLLYELIVEPPRQLLRRVFGRDRRNLAVSPKSLQRRGRQRKRPKLVPTDEGRSS